MEENISKYRNAVGTIKQAILHSQYRAAKYRQPLAVEGAEGCLLIQQLLSENGKEGEV